MNAVDPLEGPSPDPLHVALLDAHASADHARLARLNVRAADAAERRGDTDEASFFLTQAWVFALQADLPEAAVIRERLGRWGRV